ncbi:DinB family protein [Reichenbachiella versicolor]|uniref:DinB family protein n=1 Tax=Reichenbachiella versicolor TaxID=1821036 RepID=UPI000D6E4DD0|nr:DinB family protein [Reichenbachiella versicolor]
MNKANLKALYLRDLDRLIEEIKSYKDEKNLWIVENQVNNSAGNLCLHLCGNLQHFVGAIIGQSGYIRDREQEFGSRDIHRELLIQEVEFTKDAIKLGFDQYDEKLGEDIYPIEVFGKPMTNEYFLFHLIAHLNYHLGQISYHRRLIEK